MDRHQRANNQGQGTPFLVLFLACIASGVVGLAISSVRDVGAGLPVSSNTSSSNQEKLAVMQMTALVPTKTPYVTPTKTWTPVVIVVTATIEVTPDLPWCSEASYDDVCYQPGLVATALPEFVTCDVVTPRPYITTCRKRGDPDTRAKDDVE